jgi:hypothetical protein
MSFILRRIIWDDGRPSIDAEDYEILVDGKEAGRLYRTQTTAGVRWLWTVYSSSATGLAETRELAQSAFKAAWDLRVTR